jgi:tetratricopeptide (TPR) repeat protein
MLVGLGGYARYRFKSFTRAMFNYTRYATLAENSNLYFCLSYWFEFVGKLRLSEDGFYTFEGIAQENLDDFEKGRLAYHRSEFAQAITLIERDITRKGETEHKLFWLAMSYMRHAEAENCLSKLIGDAQNPTDHQQAHHEHHPSHAQYCILPLTQFHERTESARTAATLFEKLLNNYDESNRLYQWLLNFNDMAINGFPQEVPPKYLIRTSFIDAFYGAKKKEVEREFASLSFEDRAPAFGIDTHNTGRGVAVEDFDQDGYLDIVTGGGFEVLKYYKNDHGATFVDRTAEVGLSEVKQPFFVVAVDYDNDGWMDLFVSRMFGKQFLLFRNNRNGTFTDVTASSGLVDGQPEDQMVSAWTPAWADVDLDGDLDLFLAQMSIKIPFAKGVLAKSRMPPKLFINEQGHFADKTEAYGLVDIVDDQYFIGATFGDYDSDGDADLFLSSPFLNTSVLLRNAGGRRFEKTDLINRAEGGFVAAFVDVNHDGRLDIYQGGFADATTSVELAVFGEGRGQYRSGHSTILFQTSEGRFEERNDFFDMPMGTMGSSFGDINNDGCADFYLGTGTPEGWFVLPNLMYVGRTQGTGCADGATNISMFHGFGTIQKGHGIVFFDFDEDGDQDIYSSLGGMWPADRWPNQFFVNNSRLDNRWVKIRLRGRKTNAFGVGTMIKVVAENDRQEKIVRYYQMDQKTGFGSAPYLAHIGLMNATRIHSVDVFWPASKCRKTYQAELNALNVLDEKDCASIINQ